MAYRFGMVGHRLPRRLGLGAKPIFTEPPTAALVAQGHYLSTSPSGNAFWSGGANGPEGSILVLGAILLLLLALAGDLPAEAGDKSAGKRGSGATASLI